VKQKIALKDKKLKKPINGKFNDIHSANLVIKYICINLQIPKQIFKNISVRAFT